MDQFAVYARDNNFMWYSEMVDMGDRDILHGAVGVSPFYPKNAAFLQSMGHTVGTGPIPEPPVMAYDQISVPTLGGFTGATARVNIGPIPCSPLSPFCRWHKCF